MKHLISENNVATIMPFTGPKTKQKERNKTVTTSTPEIPLKINCEDIDLEIGTIRFRSHGSSGGHNGLKNIFEELNTQEIKRLKM